MPYPGGGEKWGGNGVGDDLYSFGYDGSYLWTGGRKTQVMHDITEPYIKKGDVIGCALDLTVPIITFAFNGIHVSGIKLFTRLSRHRREHKITKEFTNFPRILP